MSTHLTLSSAEAEFTDKEATSRRSETSGDRRKTLRLVDYSPFPRMSLERGRQVGLSINESDTGICLAVKDPEEIGNLIRVVVRGVDGRPVRDVATRVVWCDDSDNGHIRVGLSYLREGGTEMLRVHPNGASRDFAVA